MHIGSSLLLGGRLTPFGPGTLQSTTLSGAYSTAGNNVTVSGDATVTPDAGTLAGVLICDTFTMNGGTFTVNTIAKGLFVFAKTAIVLNSGAILHGDIRGKAGNFGDVTALSLIPTGMRADLNLSYLASLVLPAIGALGGQTALDGSMKSGGGGRGGVRGGGVTGAPGWGGPCAGGAGSGGSGYSSGTSDAGNYGLDPSAGTASNDDMEGGGGAGEPPAPGQGYSAEAGRAEGRGGLPVFLFAPSIQIASGCIVRSRGANGGWGYGWGGGAGGGPIICCTRPGGLSNLGTIHAPGGSVNAGAGSINLLTF